MSKANEEAAKAVEQMKQLRDELALKIHLGSMEAKAEWEELEKKVWVSRILLIPGTGGVTPKEQEEEDLLQAF